jgi:2-C-methyl-D-erythritol 4-phosphate cytidylyltransferase / 2-C-methyl-D-erythritol 2,4-cyclodiphosphate synthase
MSDIVAAVVVAAGRGVRAGGVLPKQYRMLNGISVIRRSLGIFADHPEVSLTQPVIHADDAELCASAIAGMPVLAPAFGGSTRQDSVRAGLEALLPHRPSIVLVHDAARPFASACLVSRAIAGAARDGAAIPGLAVTDTVKSVGSDGRVTETLDRARLRSIQTPQAFDYAVLLAAHRKAQAAARTDFTDDSALAEWAGMSVTVFEGDPDNIKLTTTDDFVRAEAKDFETLGDVRTGSGYDVHAFGDGDHVTLGGVRIPFERGLSGHSDADVALHALVDAILGALADGDIGAHFPPTDPQWRGASSDRFLKFAVERVRARGGRISLLDVTIVCEAPRIGPHRDAMRTRIAEIAGLAADRVAVKATTSEKLGFTGRREGIVAFGTATIRLPWSGG